VRESESERCVMLTAVSFQSLFFTMASFHDTPVDTTGVSNKVGYFSDCEGQWNAWQRYVAMSQVLYLPSHCSETTALVGSTELDWKLRLNDTTFATQEIQLRDDCHFVYGGDVCDRGNGDIRLLKDLMSLKERYPERVHFILGNRDVNKLRLPTMLHDKTLAENAQAYWTPSASPEVCQPRLCISFYDCCLF
jgi:hypothetical protein